MAAATCAICTLAYNDSANTPKMLECGHTFCVACLTQHHAASTQQLGTTDTKQKKGEVVKQMVIDHLSLICPACRQKTTLKAAGDVRALITNYALLQMLPIHPARPNCCRCFKPAKTCCISCRLILCGTHADEHEESNSGHECKLTSSVATSTQRRELHCNSHKRAMEYFCTNETCQMLICDRCIIDTHATHTRDVQPVEKIGNEKVAVTHSLAAEARRQAAELQECARKFAEAEKNVRVAYVAVAAEVKTACSALHKAVEERETALLAELASLTTAEEHRLAVARSRAEVLAAILGGVACMGEMATDVYAALSAASDLRAETEAKKDERLSLMSTSQAGGGQLSLHGAAQAKVQIGSVVALLSMTITPPTSTTWQISKFRPGFNYKLDITEKRATWKHPDRMFPQGYVTVLSAEGLPPTSDEHEVHLRICAANSIFVGFAPSYIKQSAPDNHCQCGWYLCLSPIGIETWAGSPSVYGAQTSAGRINLPFKLASSTPTSVWLRVNPRTRRLWIAVHPGEWLTCYSELERTTCDILLAVSLVSPDDWVELLS